MVHQILAALIIIIGSVQALAFVVATVWVLVSAVRDKPATPEEQERADMRSLLWPNES